MLGAQGEAVCKAMMESTRVQSGEWHDNSLELIQCAALQEAKEAAQQDGITKESVNFPKYIQEVEHKYESEEQVSILRTAYITQDAIDILQCIAHPLVIHCTGDSVDNKGKPVLD
ncbi:hypothetical protein OPQ81_008627 [Rhizoctonia solani]|nr:hypothetical protein OPQ81_008627 [Rhizoctonia solani]